MVCGEKQLSHCLSTDCICLYWAAGLLPWENTMHWLKSLQGTKAKLIFAGWSGWSGKRALSTFFLQDFCMQLWQLTAEMHPCWSYKFIDQHLRANWNWQQLIWVCHESLGLAGGCNLSAFDVIYCLISLQDSLPQTAPLYFMKLC